MRLAQLGCREPLTSGTIVLPSCDSSPSALLCYHVLLQKTGIAGDLPPLVIAPGLALTLVVVDLQLLGDGLRDILDPRQL